MQLKIKDEPFYLLKDSKRVALFVVQVIGNIILEATPQPSDTPSSAHFIYIMLRHTCSS